MNRDLYNELTSFFEDGTNTVADLRQKLIGELRGK